MGYWCLGPLFKVLPHLRSLLKFVLRSNIPFHKGQVLEEEWWLVEDIQLEDGWKDRFDSKSILKSLIKRCCLCLEVRILRSICDCVLKFRKRILLWTFALWLLQVLLVLLLLKVVVSILFGRIRRWLGGLLNLGGLLSLDLLGLGFDWLVVGLVLVVFDTLLFLFVFIYEKRILCFWICLVF